MAKHRLVGARLPAPRTELIGREEDVAGVVAALRGSRLLTLTGSGGTGKTRLALAALTAAPQLAPGATWWIELAGISSPELARVTAAVLGVADSPGISPFDAVVNRLGSDAALLALDNCEHLAAACAELVDDLLDCCPGVRILATSREPLAVAGETIWPVGPLTLPPAVAGATAAAVADSAAGRLFEQRARAVLPTFQLSDQIAPAVARVCRRLDGLPLAIELAAARMRVLSVEQIAAGLDDVLGLLAGGSRSAPPRQQSLRGALDWSHDLLSEPERAVFRRLSVFPGSFDLAAATQTTTGGTVAHGEIFDLLTALVDRSLVGVRRVGDQVRYRLLATVRDYAAQQLAAAGEQTPVRRAHLEHYCQLAERIEPLVTGPGQAQHLDQLEAEANNLRLALAFGRDAAEEDMTPDMATGIRLAATLWPLCNLRGHYAEGREWMDWAATVDRHAPAQLRAKALRGSGSLAALQCDYAAAARRINAALHLYRELGDHAGEASAVHVLGSVARERGRYPRAEALHNEGLQLSAGTGDRLGVARAHGYLGFAAWLQGHWGVAREHLQPALAEFRDLGEPEGIAWSLISLGTVAHYTDDSEQAETLLVEAHELSRKVNYPEGIAWSSHQRGLLALRRAGRGAEDLLRDSLALHRDLGDRWRTASALADVARAALADDRPAHAVTLLGGAARIRDEIGSTVAPCERDDHAVVTKGARDAIGPEPYAAALAQGRNLALDDLLVQTAAAKRSSPSRPATRPTASLRIQTLGAAAVQLGDRTLTPADWGYVKPRELLMLLATSPPQTKAQLGTALWPATSGPQLRNAFHTALRDLRRALGDSGWIAFSAGRYRLNRSREPQIDVTEFEDALAAARCSETPQAALPHLQRAITTYTGDFLPDLTDHEWVHARSDELRRAYGSALSGTARLLTAAGRNREATTVLRRAVAHEPYDESAYRQLMTCLAHLGEPARAAQLYHQLTKRLARELGVAPSAETTKIYHQLTGARLGGSSGTAGKGERDDSGEVR